MELRSRYSLEGVRRATTGPQEALIRRAIEVFQADDRIAAAYLVGGFAIGNADAWSDVDLQCIISDEAETSVRSSWRQIADELATTAHVQPFPFAIGGACITPDWLHFDVVFHPRSGVDPAALEGMVPLVDKAGLLPPAPVPRPDRRGEPFLPQAAVDHFLYMLGNMVSVVGRNEVIPATNGVVLVRDIDLVALLLAEQGWASTREHTQGNPFPFTKRLRGYLTEEQYGVLLSLPPIAPTIDSAIDGYVALAEAFLPRARRLAASTGAAWPADYEAASVGYFERSLGVSLRLDT
jgi:hypothetical protein